MDRFCYKNFVKAMFPAPIAYEGDGTNLSLIDEVSKMIEMSNLSTELYFPNESGDLSFFVAHFDSP